MDNEARPEGWRFEKTISVSQVISMVMLMGTVVLFGSDLRAQQQLTAQALAQAMAAQRATDQRQDEERSEMRRAAREDLKIINEKLDRLILREVRR